MNLKIVVRFNGLVLETMDLKPGNYDLGRGPENQININHPSVHRKHGNISFISNKWIYQDHETQKIQTIDNLEPIFLSSEIDLATEEYTFSEQTGSRSVLPRKKQRAFLAFSGALIAVLILGVAYFLIKNRLKHSDPNQLLSDVRSKIVEFEKIKDIEAIEDYKKYGGFSDTDFRDNMGYCTGFLVAPNVVLTASHCLWGSDLLDLQDSFELRMHDGKKFKPLQVLGFDPVRDFLFLQLAGAEEYGHLEFADDYKIGQTVYTLGNAHGQGIAIREGIMANETQDLNDPSIKYIRYSAGASPGNSGGPLLDADGKIVALVFAATGAENYNLGTSCHDLEKGFQKFVKD
ncbi:serine protease, partial [bacterium]|nr:serine protease [bacterium]